MKLNLSKVLFYGSAVLVGSIGGMALQLSISQQSVNQLREENAVEEESKVQETIEEAEGIPVLSEEGKKASQESVPAPKLDTTTPKNAKKMASTPQPVKPTVPEPVKNGPTIITRGDYDKSILGTCPSQRDKTNEWEIGSRLPAIGIITAGENKTSPYKSLNSFIENWWDSYKQGRWGKERHMMASLNNVAGFDNTWANSRVAFFIDFNGLFVNWDNSWEDGKSINISDDQSNYLNKLVSDGTNYLRSLDARYEAKCPND